jgi:hypothetical protein
MEMFAIRSSMSGIDWPELTRQILTFFLGAISGVLLTFLADRLATRREEAHLTPRLLVFTEYQENFRPDPKGLLNLYSVTIGANPDTEPNMEIEKGWCIMDLTVTVTNVGRLPVSIAKICLEYVKKDEGSRAVTALTKLENIELPTRIDVGSSVELHHKFDKGNMSHSAMKSIGYELSDVWVQDSERRIHVTDRWFPDYDDIGGRIRGQS